MYIGVRELKKLPLKQLARANFFNSQTPKKVNPFIGHNKTILIISIIFAKKLLLKSSTKSVKFVPP
jgi:hypothetical protein